jgi:SnoaL-like protein
VTHPVARYVPLLIDGDLDGLLELFGNVPRVNDPRLGWVEGPTFELFVATSHEGLSVRQAHVEHLTTTSTALGAVEECVLSLVREGRTVRLPVAVAAVIASDVLTSLHIYHSMLPLMGAHAIRGSILPARPGIGLPEVVARYLERVAAGDVTGTLEQFEAAGVVREPTGEDYEHRGTAELMRFYGRLLASGGISVERCALTDDGTSCALEYNLTALGSILVPHQAGIAVFERAPTGLLAAVRLYDDFERPTATA